MTSRSRRWADSTMQVVYRCKRALPAQEVEADHLSPIKPRTSSIGNRESNPKLQAPNPNSLPNPSSLSTANSRRGGWQFVGTGNWEWVGAWSLGFDDDYAKSERRRHPADNLLVQTVVLLALMLQISAAFFTDFPGPVPAAGRCRATRAVPTPACPEHLLRRPS